MRVSVILIAAVLGTVTNVTAAAQTPVVDGARQAAQVGERYDGYLGVAVAPSTVLRSQVAAINIRRRKLYNNLAVSRGVSPQEVGITAGCQLLSRVQPGQAYMLADRQWRRRLPGQPPPVPGYCR